MTEAHHVLIRFPSEIKAFVVEEDTSPLQLTDVTFVHSGVKGLSYKINHATLGVLTTIVRLRAGNLLPPPGGWLDRVYDPIYKNESASY